MPVEHRSVSCILYSYCHCERIKAFSRERSVAGSNLIPLYMPYQYYVYIITNIKNTVLYTGVTNDLHRRTFEHKHKLIEGFTKKYQISKLVYYDVFDNIEFAIAREKQIKGGSRQKKIELIKSINPDFKDLYDSL